jgi:oxygen-independent coproporphyrinogen-3 oxidase
MQNLRRKIEHSAVGLYCHVPFCAHRCAYCAFYQESAVRNSIELYLETVKKELELLSIGIPFDTIYVGGGTPGVLTAKDLERLCVALLKNNENVKPVEFSVEFSPGTVRKEKVEVLKNYHCNRVTIGVQSFNPVTLKALGRRQNSEQVSKAMETIVSCGIENVGIDLIFGVPSQTLGQWIGDLRCAVKLNPKHISTYNLTLEENTPMRRDAEAGIIREKSEDEEVKFHLSTWNFLRSSGFEQYEISNFSRPGFESVHNLNTWKMQDWVGVGPSACSQYENQRFANPPSLKLWANSIIHNELAHANVDRIDEKTLAEDSIIFGLRMNRGIDLCAVKKRFHAVDFSKMDELFAGLAEENLVEKRDGWVKLTDGGRLVADAVAREILAF